MELEGISSINIPKVKIELGAAFVSGNVSNNKLWTLLANLNVKIDTTDGGYKENLINSFLFTE